MSVPQGVRDRMEKAGRGPNARAEGVKITQETLVEVADKVVGSYIMPPFGRHIAAMEILSILDGYGDD